MPRGPVDTGPRRFIRRWLAFDEARPMSIRKLWMLIASVLLLLAASALLALLSSGGAKP
jgi:hypothetical protein